MIDLSAYNPLTREIISAAMEVHSILGCGYLESVYQKAMEHELRLRGIPFASKAHFDVPYKGIIAGDFVPDLFVYECVLTELKAQENIDYDEILKKVLNYLVASRQEVALMINFGKAELEYKRYLLPEKHQ